jgi:hypothetical protein
MNTSNILISLNNNKKHSIIIYLCCLYILLITMDVLNNLLLDWYDFTLNIYTTVKSTYLDYYLHLLMNLIYIYLIFINLI